MKQEEIIAYSAKNGFVWGPEPEIYGGKSGFYTFGPLGKLLKNNVENVIREAFVRNGFFEVECPTVMPEEVWKASGHLDGFRDPIIKCSKCSSTFRTDKLIEELYPDVSGDSMTEDEQLSFIEEKGIKCLSCKGKLTPKIESHELMMRTTIGVDEAAYNRPETATTTYLPWIKYFDFFRSKLPIKVFQIGKAYRNEISPRQNVVRGREFTQAEGQIFILPEQEMDFPEFEKVKDEKLPLWHHSFNDVKEMTLGDAIEKNILKKPAYAWCLWLGMHIFDSMGIPRERMRYRQHHPDKMAHYADDAWDLEVKLNSFSWTECLGVHDRTDFDLKTHSKFSGKDLVASLEGGKKVTPHILEIAFGSDRPTFALVDIFLENSKEHGSNVLKIPARMAPIHAAVFPIVKKDGLQEIAHGIWQELLKEGLVAVYDESGSIGKRYRRMDEKGTPFCITVDYDTKEKGTVTIRERDSMKQERVRLEDIASKIKEKMR
jgi:glycyl-tRNA synthetase